jgi:hypothetical protein
MEIFMPQPAQYDENDPRHHTAKLLSDFEQKNERAWKAA